MLGQLIKIQKIHSHTNINIINYLYKNGVIVGKKIIHNKYVLPIIQFEDYSRIWILPEELEFIKEKKNWINEYEIKN